MEPSKADTYVLADPGKPLSEMTELEALGRELFDAINARRAEADKRREAPEGE